MKSATIKLMLWLLFGANIAHTQTSNDTSLAVMPMDSRGMEYDNRKMASLLRMEVEKLQVVSVLDPYEVEEVLKEQSFPIEECFSKNCLSAAGKLLKVDQVLSGTIEKFGNKTIITLRLIDVSSKSILATNVTEYISLEKEIQRMIRISVMRIFGQEPDKVLVDQLVNIETPVTADHSLLKLNGPRFGVSWLTGENQQRLLAPKDEGGFDMFPVSFMIGYQQEFRYQSVGNFQALIEIIGSISGLESGNFMPSLTFMNGFRWGKGGWEVGFGPTLRFIKRADGFYDTDGLLGESGKWRLTSEWDQRPLDSTGVAYHNPIPYDVLTRIDSRGNVSVSAGLLVAVGKTFQSGYLNIPVNVFFSPRKDGSMWGVSCGFNISRKRRNE